MIEGIRVDHIKADTTVKTNKVIQWQMKTTNVKEVSNDENMQTNSIRWQQAKLNRVREYMCIYSKHYSNSNLNSNTTNSNPVAHMLSEEYLSNCIVYLQD